MKIGYARVSKEDQNLDRQITALRMDGCEKIFSDKMGGSYKSRPEFDKMLDALVPGDTVVIQKLDRLGRSVRNLLDLVDMFKAKGIELRSLGDNFDTNTSVGRFFFVVISAFAEFEREIIRERTVDGLKQARLNGKILGAPKKDFSKEFAALNTLSGTSEEIAKELGISRSKYYRLKKIIRLQTDKAKSAQN